MNAANIPESDHYRESESVLAATVTLPAKVLPYSPLKIGNVQFTRGDPPSVRYHGPLSPFTLAVDIIDQEQAGKQADRPGTVTLVTGHLSLAERAQLRAMDVSFVTADGAMHLSWPHLAMSLPGADESRASSQRAVRRPRAQGGGPTDSMTPGFALVAQQLLTAAASRRSPYRLQANLARDAAVSQPTVSKALTWLEDRRLVEVQREGRANHVRIVDAPAIGNHLRNAPGRTDALGLRAYVYGRNLDERLESLQSLLDPSHVPHEGVAVTGLVAAAAHGVPRAGIRTIDLWLQPPNDQSLHEATRDLGLEPIDTPDGPVRVLHDRHGLGTQGAVLRDVAGGQLPVANIVRTWLDLEPEPRGADVAAQLLDLQSLQAHLDRESASDRPR